MDSLSNLARRSFAATCAVAAIASFSCAGDVGPGDYQGYRIAATSATTSGTCSFDSEDTTTILQGGTIVLFAVTGSDGEVFQIDLGGPVLKGYASDTGFSFQGKSTEIEDNGTFTITTNTTINVSFDVDGAEVTNGKYSTKTEANCSAGDCTGIQGVNCTRSSTFTGVEIDNGDLEFANQSP